MPAEQQIALPMPRDGAILSLCGALGDVDHVRDPAAILRAPTPATLGPSGAQLRGQLPAQLPARLDIQRLVDRLVTDPHLPIIRMVKRESG